MLSTRALIVLELFNKHTILNYQQFSVLRDSSNYSIPFIEDPEFAEIVNHLLSLDYLTIVDSEFPKEMDASKCYNQFLSFRLTEKGKGYIKNHQIYIHKSEQAFNFSRTAIKQSWIAIFISGVSLVVAIISLILYYLINYN